jgi:hypothetical protein
MLGPPYEIRVAHQVVAPIVAIARLHGVGEVETQLAA